MQNWQCCHKNTTQMKKIAKPSTKMDLLTTLVKNSLFHAFNALRDGKDGCVPKSRLLVFTASLGNHLKQENIERGLPEHRSTQHLKFHDFVLYLEKELFESLPKDLSAHQLNKLHFDIDDICWLVCKRSYFNSGKSAYPEEYYFKLFRIFCAQATLHETQEQSNVILDAAEVQYLANAIDKVLGNDIAGDSAVSTDDFNDCTLYDFISFMEMTYSLYEKAAVLESVDELYDIFVENVIKQGYMKKLLTPIGPWWEMWCVLKQHSLTWRSKKTMKEHWGEIDFESSKIQVEGGTGTQFSLIVNSKAMMFNTVDYPSKLQWVSAFKVALNHCNMLEPFQHVSTLKRQRLKKELDATLEEEKRLFDLKEEIIETRTKEKMQLELELERESAKLKELQCHEQLLLAQLEEERQATKDEETVRNLQSRMLEEEWGKVELLEKQQLEKEEQLEKEKEKREQLETTQKETQEEIEKLTTTVSSLTKEKDELSGTLKRTKILIDTRYKDPEVSTGMKRSMSADLSQVHSGKWCVSNPKSAQDDDY